MEVDLSRQPRWELNRAADAGTSIPGAHRGPHLGSGLLRDGLLPSVSSLSPGVFLGQSLESPIEDV